jgi:hypothetical protein
MGSLGFERVELCRRLVGTTLADIQIERREAKQACRQEGEWGIAIFSKEECCCLLLPKTLDKDTGRCLSSEDTLVPSEVIGALTFSLTCVSEAPVCQ